MQNREDLNKFIVIYINITDRLLLTGLYLIKLMVYYSNEIQKKNVETGIAHMMKRLLCFMTVKFYFLSEI